jgi:hypothetical protein
MPNILVISLSCTKNAPLWPKLIELEIQDHVILCGGAEKTKLEGKILYLKCCDTYDGLSEKMLKAIDFILNCEKFSHITHILKADDHDTELSSYKITEISHKFKEELEYYDYIGQQLLPRFRFPRHHFGKVPIDSVWHNKEFMPEKTSSYLGGGTTYILSRWALLYINQPENKEYYIHYLYEDLMMGVILDKYSIKPYKLYYGIRTWRG